MSNTERGNAQYETQLDGQENFSVNTVMPQDYGKRIAEARGELTQKALGDMVGAAQTTISSWENYANSDSKREPSIEDFEKIGDATGYSPAWLAFGLGPKKPGGEFVAIEELEREKLFKIIAGVERYLSSKSMRLTPEKKGRLIIGLYDSLGAIADEQVLSQELERYLSIAKRP